MSKRCGLRRSGSVALALAGAAAAALPLVAAAPSVAADEAAPRAKAQVLSCTTDSDGWTGRADCTNNTGSVVAFRVVVVCGWWPDQYGAWRTLDPGRSGTSSATCGGGTGVGSVSWQEG
ncbi:hypothetical protein ACFY41_00595 [Streptomyces syringium]|uniref:hypothetical protein n=1 Tax=Streptomyces syringium TaxID=76729 RepID=UPI0034544260